MPSRTGYLVNMIRLKNRKQGNVEGSVLCGFQDSVINSIDFSDLSGEPRVSR